LQGAGIKVYNLIMEKKHKFLLSFLLAALVVFTARPGFT
jgi:hypothetical protein